VAEREQTAGGTSVASRHACVATVVLDKRLARETHEVPAAIQKRGPQPLNLHEPDRVDVVAARGQFEKISRSAEPFSKPAIEVRHPRKELREKLDKHRPLACLNHPRCDGGISGIEELSERLLDVRPHLVDGKRMRAALVTYKGRDFNGVEVVQRRNVLGLLDVRSG
jgi:hypothetical protein